MRIAIASIHPRPMSGQIEELIGLAQALEGHGHTVTIVSAFPSQVLRSSERLHLGNKSHPLFINVPFRIASILAELVRLASQVDLIQLNLPTPSFSVLADMLALAVRVPVVVNFEAHLVATRDLARLDRLKGAPAFYLPRWLINNRLIARLTLHSAARYLVATEYQKEELASLGVDPERIHQTPNLIPQDKLQRVPRDEARARLGLPAGRIVTYLGHYNHVKGVDVLARAFQKLAPRFDDLYLALAWSGQGKSRGWQSILEEPELRGRVLQIGHVSVPELMSASDVVALPYRMTIGQAAYPATLLEAISANVPIVTSDLPLLRELVENAPVALLARPEDPGSLAAAITCLLTEANLSRRMVMAQQRWMRQMNPHRVVRNYEQIYEQVVSERAPVLSPTADRSHI